jgi:tetratricopeptide (TPR) repeat protein
MNAVHCMRRWFLSYNSSDSGNAERIEAALKAKDAGAQVFFAPKNLRAGGYWQPVLAQEIANATAFLLIVGEKGVGPWQVLEYYEALDKRVKSPEFPVVLVLLEGQPAPGLPFLRQLHWIITADPASERTIAQIADAGAGAGAAPGELWRYTSPYRGLAAMAEADSDFFFGRQRETVAVIETLSTASGSIPVLLGNSGVGKSSLAQAGVLAALKRQAWPEGADTTRMWPHGLRESRHWCFLTLKPGAEPLKALVNPFLDSWQYGATDPERVKQQNGWIELLRDGKASLSDLIDATERRYGELAQLKPPAFFLYVDQGEELYVRSEEHQRQRFSQVLAQGVGDPRLVALMSLRSDFLGALQSDEPLYAAHQKIDVPPLREAELREVVSQPARRLSARFDSEGLVDIITRRTAEDSARDAGALPLLSYTLDDMWTQMVRRGDGVLRLPAEAFEPGGVLADRANAFLATHPGAEEVLRRVLTLKLASVRESGEPTRRPAPRSEFTDAEWRLVSELADYPHRLLVTATPPGGETYAEIAHEAIFRRWSTLREWLAAEREFLIWKSGLEADRRRWEQAPERRRNDALLMGLALAQAEAWRINRGEDISGPDREFIDRSLRREELERRQREALRRYMLATATVALVIVTALALFSYLQWGEADRQRVEAVKQEETAKLERQRAERAADTFFSRMISIFSAGDRASEVLDQEIDREPTDITAHIMRVMIASQKQDYDREIEALDAMIRLSPQFQIAYFVRGQAYARKNDYDRAIADFDRALAVGPDKDIIYDGRGDAFYKKGDYARALADYNHAITLNPKYAVAYNDRGNVYWAKNEYDRALADYDQAIALDPNNSSSYFWYDNKCGVYFDKHDYDLAIASCDQSIKLNPKYAVAYNRRGNVYWAKGDYDRGLADYDQAIVLDPNSSDSYFWYGNKCGVYSDKHDYDLAIASCDQSIKLNPKYAWAYNRRGNVYWAKGDYDRALADYDQAIALEPNKARSYIWHDNKCRVYYVKRDYDRAIASCEQAIKLNSKYGEPYNRLGNIYFARQDYDRAVAYYSTAISLNPKSATLYTNRGNAFYWKNDLRKAIEDFIQAINLDPGYDRAYFGRGDVYLKDHDYDRAVADYDQAITINPKSALYYHGRGNAYRGKGDFDRALADYDQAIQINPRFALAMYGRGLAFYQKREYDKAIAEFDRALALSPKMATALFARGLAKLKNGDAVGGDADIAAAKAIKPSITDEFELN